MRYLRGLGRGDAVTRSASVTDASVVDAFGCRVGSLTRKRRVAFLRAAGLATVTALLASTLAPAHVEAVVVGGGGSARLDCLAVFDVPANVPRNNSKSIRCTDGDPSCDADGVVNGACEFPIAVCANSDFSPLCTDSGVQSITIDHAVDDGDPKFRPELQALQGRVHDEIDLPTTASDQCTSPTTFRLPVRGPYGPGVCKPRKDVVRMVTISMLIDGFVYRDVDRLKVRCDPAPDGCSARSLFTSTFDRIQKQIFNQSCAVSGCHDSQTKMGGLLLESGASLTNLVDVAPTNLNANAAGWQRVHVLDASTGDPLTSLLYAKLVGPPQGFGARMPFGKPKLDQSLIDVVQLWIAAGAPANGWVPGTD